MKNTGARNRKLLIIAAVAGSFLTLSFVIVVLLGKQIVSPEMASLMFVGLLGLYFGFGVLIAVYRFVARLE